MEWQGRLNEAMDYVEENLSGRIDPERAAQLAACSGYHFQRMFAYLTGVTFSEYVRRRRMSAAALELLSGDARVIDLAARYGYESPTAFNRAFQAVHGVPPSAARTRGVLLSSFPRMTFTLTLKGEEKMDYRIENKGPIRVVGAALKGTMDFDESQKRIPLFWNEMGQAGLIPRLCALMDGSEPAGVLGVSLCGDGVCNGYYIAVATGRDVPEGMEAYDIPAGTWAVFECRGPMPEAIQSMQRRALAEWLPTSGYEYADAPDVEVYFDGDMSTPDYRSQVWLPIVKKN